MTKSTERDFRHLCDVYARWVAKHGLSQQAVVDKGGPSKPIQTQLARGEWHSGRPRGVVNALDRGLEWPKGTAWRVLNDGYDPLTDPTFVGGSTQDAAQYVESTGERVESGITNEDLLREILRSRADADQIRAEQREQRNLLGALSDRVAKLEEPRP